MYLRKYRFLFSRRIIQVGILFFFLAGNIWGWSVLRGNLSAAELFEIVPLADPYHVSQMFAALSLPATEALTGAAIVFLFYAVLAGRAFCGWVCPMNIITDAANWLRKKLGISSSVRMDRNVRYWIIGLSLIISALLSIAAFEWVSPISMLHRGVVLGMGFGWLAVLSVFLFDLLVIKDGFCGHVCPLGGFYALTGRFSIIKPGFDNEKCNACMKCIDTCPEKQVLHMVGKEDGLILSGECTNCGRCIEVCDPEAIQFRNRFK